MAENLVPIKLWLRPDQIAALKKIADLQEDRSVSWATRAALDRSGIQRVREATPAAHKRTGRPTGG